MLKYFVIRNLRGARSSVEMLKGYGTCLCFEMLMGYMLVCQNAEREHGQRKVGNPYSKVISC